MIFVIHTLYFVFKLAMKIYHRRQALLEFECVSNENDSIDTIVIEDAEKHFGFSSPVYLQRYTTIQDLLADSRWKKEIKCVADFGCGEFQLFKYLKQLPFVRKVYEIDIDQELLLEYKHRLQPLTADYLAQRTDPLTVQVLLGSINDPDNLLKQVDAVVGIEIIEHLFPDTLDGLPHNVFGFIQPKIAIFTTPNAEFNVLFPNFTGFRHPDHKFEWTRGQFEEWALNITRRYPNYSVEFRGIGSGRPGTESLGCCSQLALFVKQYEIVQSELQVNVVVPMQRDPEDYVSFGICTHFSYFKQIESLRLEDFQIEPDSGTLAPKSEHECSNYYKIIDTIVYPYVEDHRTTEERLLQDIRWTLQRWGNCNSRFYNEDKERMEIPLYELTRIWDETRVTEHDVREILEAAGFSVAECVAVNGAPCQCVLYEIADDMDTSGSSSKFDDGDLEDDGAVPDEASSPAPLVAATANGGAWSVDGESDWESADSHNVAVAMNNKKEDEVPTPSDPLVDSGYQKSLSNAEWSPQSPMEGHFDDSAQFGGAGGGITTKLDVNDIKESIKARIAQNNGKYAANTMNNRVLSERRYFLGAGSSSTARRTPPPGPLSIAGTSDISRRRNRKLARKSDSVPCSSSSDEENKEQDVKSIANCLLYNSLNRIDVDERVAAPAPAAEDVLDAGPMAHHQRRPERLNLPVVIVDDPHRNNIVENGDLANNNRDNEGNNYPMDAQNHHHQQLNVRMEDDDIVDVAENAIEQNANNERGAVLDEQNRNVRIQPVLVEYPVAVDEDDEQDERGDDEEINHASREALFDPNSQQDMLDDVPCSPHVTLQESSDVSEVHDSIQEENSDDIAVDENNPFPAWLLQLFGSQSDGSDGNQEEPHFYCQGDGLGVHPSIVEVDVDDSSDSSSTDDEAQAERTISEDDVVQLPADTVAVTVVQEAEPPVALLEVIGRSVEMPPIQSRPLRNNPLRRTGSTESADEYYDTIDDDDEGDENDEDNVYNNGDDGQTY